MDTLTSHEHFKRAAPTYALFRNTDPIVVDVIISHLTPCDCPVDVAEAGCGTGRYSSLLAAKLDKNLRLYCCDYSRAMLTQCQKCLGRGFSSPTVRYSRVNANYLPFRSSSFDAVVIFNAVHHLDLDRFVGEAARLLRPGGLLSIYTRTPEQNARTVWGRYFPGFVERETRLYSRKRLEETIHRTPRLLLETVQEFQHRRAEPLESLLDRVRHLHYSTFAFYTRPDLARAMKTFAAKLEALPNNGVVEHTAENTLVIARRCPSQ